MPPRRLLAISGGLALAALLAVGLVQLARRSQRGSAPAVSPLAARVAEAQLTGSPPPLARLHAQADELLASGHGALHARLRQLRGWPVVVNKWASWCTPCKAERSVFQHAAAALGRRVAFIGVDSGDHSRAEAHAFLRGAPLSYPSYYDPSERVGVEITDSSFTPVTVFYDRRGGEYIHQGAYPSVARLERDVERYALAD